MSPSREFNADNVEKAVVRAASALQIPESEVSYEVLDPGSEGFLGIGARDARIQVALPHSEDFDDHIAESSATDDSDNGTDDVDLPSPSELSDDTEVDDEDAESDEDRDGQDGLEAELLNTSERDSESVEEDLPATSPESLEEIRSHVEGIVTAMDIRSRVDVYDVGDHVAVDISSDHTALLIGQKGETIDALQHLINSAAFRRGPVSKRVILDSEGYRQRRIEALQGMAHRSARKAQREEREIKMPPMNSSERRVIHLYLEDNSDVSTYSEGRGNDRRVVISPN